MAPKKVVEKVEKPLTRAELVDIVKEVVGTLLPKQETATEQIASVVGTTEEAVAPAGTSIHPTHRQLVDQILGKQFAAWEVYDQTPSTHFLFNIEVPRDLSPVSDADYEKGMRDVRSKAISNAEGESGVRAYCMLVRKNLNQYYTSNAIQSPFTE